VQPSFSIYLIFYCSEGVSSLRRRFDTLDLVWCSLPFNYCCNISTHGTRLTLDRARTHWGTCICYVWAKLIVFLKQRVAFCARTPLLISHISFTQQQLNTWDRHYVDY